MTTELRTLAHEVMVEPVDTSWHVDALCLGMETQVFYPVGRGMDVVQRVRDTKKLCKSCPVISTCLNDALSRDPVHDWGVWGGTSRVERMNMRRAIGKKVAA